MEQDATTLLWLTGGLAFVIGLVFGGLLFYLLSPLASKRASQKKYEDIEQEYREYQDKVADHFSSTAHMMSKMTESYKDMHEHLATVAEDLCTDEMTRHRLTDSLIGSNTLLSKQSKANGVNVEPPLDYAPKPAGQNHGTLSDTFGVQSEHPKTGEANH